MIKQKLHTSKRLEMMNKSSLYSVLFIFFNRFVINQLFDGSNPDNQNLMRYLTVYPENTSNGFMHYLFRFKILKN